MALRLRYIFTTAGATLLGGSLSLTYTFLAAKLLAPHENGHYAQFVLIFNLYYILLNFGFGPASTYFISSGQMQEQRVISLNLKILSVIGLVSGLFVILICLGDVGTSVEANFKIPLVLLISGIVAGFFLLVLNQAMAILIGKNFFDAVNLLNVIKMALPFPIVGLMLIISAGELSFAIATLVSLILVSILGLKLVAQNFVRMRFNDPVGLVGLTPSIFRYGGLVYASNVMHYMAMRGLLIILSYHYSPDYVGFFSMALVFLETLLILPGVIGQLIFPLSSDPKFNYELTDTIMRLNFYVGIITVFGVFWLAQWGVESALGVHYESVAIVLIHLIPSIFLLAIPRILSQVLSGSGHPEYPLYASIISLIGGGAIALWSIPLYGLVGGAWVINFVSGVTAVVTIFGYTRLRDVGVLDVFSPRLNDLYLVRNAVRRIFGHWR